ncbi:MAG TPA: RHS repeat protein [Anaerolineae bacterium]|nr:RHS repeat protein [Anaerolineae bacterium]
MLSLLLSCLPAARQHGAAPRQRSHRHRIRIHDDLGRLIRVTDWATGTTPYDYDPAVRLITMTLPNGVQTTHSYDAAGRLTALLHAHGATVLASCPPANVPERG